MTSHDDTKDPIEAYITSYLLYLDGDGERPDLSDLEAAEREEVSARIRLLDVARGDRSEATTGAMNRIAKRFGFDRTGTRIAISGARFKAVRQQSQRDLKGIAAAATAAGAPIRTSDLLKVENARATLLDQELVSVLVAVLRTSLAAIEGESTDDASVVHTFLAGPLFSQLIAEWAGAGDLDPDDVRNTVTGRVLATHYRAEDIAEKQLVDLVRAILRSLER